MTLVRKMIIFIFGPSSPLNFLGILIYRLTYLMVKTFWNWRFPSIRLWVRNSFYTNDIVPGLSDIDLTILSTKDELDPFAIESIHFLKSIFIILGEINFYSNRSLELIKDIHNSYELQRDPILMSFAQIKVTSSPIDASIFLLRTYESDRDNLQKRSKLRIRKWAKVFKIFNIEINELNRDRVDQLLNERVGEDILKNEMISSPHRWLENNWSTLQNIEVINFYSHLDENACQIVAGQIRWEVFGILTQLPFLKNRKEMINHFENLKRITLLLPPLQSTKLVNQLERAKLLV